MTTTHPLNAWLAQADSPPLAASVLERFDAYLALLLRWNGRTNLTAIRTPDEILRRHFLESILAARLLPAPITTLLDFGSGAGFPGLPIALCRPTLAVTLAESQHKKAAFLREAVRTLQLPVTVHSDRAQTLTTSFDCITLRAVDSMAESIAAAIPLLAPGGWLAVLTTDALAQSVRAAAGTQRPAAAFPSGAQTVHDPDLQSLPGLPDPNPDPLDKSSYSILWSDPQPLPTTRQQTLLLGRLIFA